MRPQCLSLCALFVLLSGCATFDHRAGFDEVSATVQARSGKRVVWNLGTELDAQVTQDVHILYKTPSLRTQRCKWHSSTTASSRPCIELGVAQADLVQAGLLAQPHV